MYLENDTLLVKLWKVSIIFIMTVLHYVWGRVFLGIGPSSTWISFLESINFWDCRGRKWWKQNSNVRRSERRDCGIISCKISVSWHLHFWAVYHNIVGRSKAEEVMWSSLRSSTSIQDQMSTFKHKCWQHPPYKFTKSWVHWVLKPIINLACC